MSVLKWHGGKSYLAKWILQHFPPHTDYIHYVEPFFGGGSVLFEKPIEHIEDHSEVVSDILGDLTTFWRVLAHEGEFKRFVRAVEATPLTDTPLRTAYECEDVERAYQFFVKYRQSRQAMGTCFATLSKNRTRRGMNEQVSAWLNAVEGLHDTHKRLKRVVVLHRNAFDVIGSEDSPNTFFYLDPPYHPDTRTTKDAYEFEFTAEHHEKLLARLATIEGRFLLSGYDHESYRDYETLFGWNRVELRIDNKASSKKVKDTKVECLWKNY